MRRILLLAMAFTIWSASAVCLAADPQLGTGINFEWWHSNKSEDARQLYVPLRADAGFGDFSVTVLAAYAETHLETPYERPSLSDFLDTKLIASYRIFGKLPVDIILGLDLNLPTGKTNLSRRQLDLIMDPDLIAVNNYGEGFDINPTVTIAKQWGKWMTGMGLGYLWRDSYDFCSELELTDYQPGAVYSVVPELRYQYSRALMVRLFGKYIWYGKDTLQGMPAFQQGDLMEIGAGFDYHYRKQWQTSATFRSIFRDKSKFQIAAGVLATEANSFEGDEFVLDLGASVFPNRFTTVRTYFQGRYFTENDYAPDSEAYVGMREKALLGVGVNRTLTPRLEAGMDVRAFVKHDDRANFPSPRAARDYHGVSLSIQLAGKF